MVIEHNLDVIKTADWVIDMGPEGGSRGGTVIAEGTPEQIANSGDSYTGVFLKPILDGRAVSVGSIQPELVAATTDPPRKGAARTAPAKKAAAATKAPDGKASDRKAPETKAPVRTVKKATSRTPARKAS